MSYVVVQPGVIGKDEGGKSLQAHHVACEIVLIASVLAIPPSPESEAATVAPDTVAADREARPRAGRPAGPVAGFEVPAVGKPMPDMHFTCRERSLGGLPTAAAQVIRRRRAQGVQALVEGEATQEKSTFEDPVVAGARPSQRLRSSATRWPATRTRSFAQLELADQVVMYPADEG